MRHARVQGVRGSWVDSVKDTLFNLNKSNQLASSFLPLRQGERENSSDHWSRSLKSNVLLHRFISGLVVVLLIIIAYTTISSFTSWAETTERVTKSELSLSSQLITQKLERTPSLETAIVSPTLTEVYLEDALPAEKPVAGRVVFLLNKDKKVIASFPRIDKYVGQHLGQLTGDVYALMRNQKNSNVNLVETANVPPSYAIYQPLASPAKKHIGGVLVLQSKRAVFSQWRSEVFKISGLFLGVIMTLLIILYVYLAQNAQANANDQLYLETNARFDTALARGRCGLWDWDLAHGRIVWSSSMYQILGMEPHDGILSYGELVELVHPQDLDLMELANHAFDQENGNIDRRFRMMHSSGTWVWMRIRAELVRHKDAAPHLIGIAVDISEQEAIKQQSREADIRLRDAIENISEAFVLWDAKKRLVMCNTKYQQLYNLPASAVTSGSIYEDVMAQSRKPRVRNEIPAENNPENGAETFELQVEGNRWLQFSQRRTLDGGFVSVGTDITLIKRNQEKLKQSEHLQIETISDLRRTQQELEIQAQQLVEIADNLSVEKMRADAANQAKAEFLANISHELRTPLNAIIGFSDIMISNMFGPLGHEKYGEYVGDIHDSGNFLLGVINDVLDMSKIEAGRFLIHPEQVQLHEVLKETIRIIKIQADDAGIKVSHKIPKTLELEVDRRAIKQILLNLLSNSVKFTNSGGKIDITAKRLNDSVSIEIKDNGIGIAPDALNRVALPFEQVQDQFTKNHKGSGLGLAIARSLAMLHGGTLEIDSTLDVGTTVTVELPLKCEIEQTVDDPVQVEAA